MNGEEEDGEEAISDSELFRRAMRDVRPLESAPRALPQLRRPKARARFARAEREAVLNESLHAPGPLIDSQPGDELIYRRPGVPETVLRRLRRGDYRIDVGHWRLERELALFNQSQCRHRRYQFHH